MSVVAFPARAHRAPSAKTRLELAVEALVRAIDHQRSAISEYRNAVRNVDAAVQHLDGTVRGYGAALASLQCKVAVVGHESRKLASLIDRARAA